jgi:amino acid transporter
MKDDKIFDGSTANYCVSIILAGVMQFPSAAYIQYAGAYGGDSNAIILSTIGLFLSLIISFMTVFSRLGYLRRSQLLVILLIIPVVNFVFCIVLMFLNPISLDSNKNEAVKKNTKSDFSNDDEINELEKQIKIKKLQKELRELEKE